MIIARRAFVSAIGALALPRAARAAPQHRFTLESATIADVNAAMNAGALSAEALTRLHLARIARYDPKIRAVITLDPQARAIARALDHERRMHGPRSLLHGITIVLKDNIDAAGLPTSGGSFVLAQSVPRGDAFIVRRLRNAGAIILGKVNLSEFAAGPPFSSVHGQTYNPYDHSYIAGGSSGGSGAAIASGFAFLALGTDTGGSVRGPASIDGIVGLKPTTGLLSMAGIMPLALSFDTPGPMGRSVYDVAAMLGVMVAPDPNDPAKPAPGPPPERDYTRFLDPSALAGARIGLVRTFSGNDADHDRVLADSAAAITAAGGTIVEVTMPAWMMAVKGDFYTTVRWPEFRPQFEAYLTTLSSGQPRTLVELARRSRLLSVPNAQGYIRNDARWNLFDKEMASGSTDDPIYRAMRHDGLTLIRTALEAMLDHDRLDALLYLTTSVRPPRVDEPAANDTSAAFASTAWATQFASLAGLPDLVVPAGFTGDGLPIGVSFMGRAYAEPRLFALGHAFERLRKARRAPPNLPALRGEIVNY